MNPLLRLRLRRRPPVQVLSQINQTSGPQYWNLSRILLAPAILAKLHTHRLSVSYNLFVSVRRVIARAEVLL